MIGYAVTRGPTRVLTGPRFDPLRWSRWSEGLTAAQMLDLDFSKTDRTFQTVIGSALADDAGESIALALDSASWGGLTLAQEVATQTELKDTGTTGLVGTATAATYNTTTGAGSITRANGVANQSFVSFPVVAGAYYEVDFEVGSIFGVAVRPSSGAVAIDIVVLSAGRVKRRYTSTTTSLIFTANADTTVPFTIYSIKRIPGNAATQATGASQPSREAGLVSRYDGTADNLLTTFLPASGPMTLLYNGTVPATLAALQVLMGSSGSSANRCWLGITTAGFICAGVGSQTESTIVGTTDVRGKTIVAAVTFDGTTVSLFLLVDGATTQEYSAAQASTPTTTIPFRVGALNNNGTAGSFAAVDIKSAKAARRAMTLQEFRQIAASL